MVITNNLNSLCMNLARVYNDIPLSELYDFLEYLEGQECLSTKGLNLKNEFCNIFIKEKETIIECLLITEHLDNETDKEYDFRLRLSIRLRNSLINGGIDTIEKLKISSVTKIRKFRGVGEKQINLLLKLCSKNGIILSR